MGDHFKSGPHFKKKRNSYFFSKTVFVGQEKCADENVKQIECHLQNNEFQTTAATTSSTPPPTTAATRAASSTPTATAKVAAKKKSNPASFV